MRDSDSKLKSKLLRKDIPYNFCIGQEYNNFSNE